MIPGAALDAALIEHIHGQFRAQNLPTIFRLTGLEAPDTDAQLAAQGFSLFEPSAAMIADIPD